MARKVVPRAGSEQTRERILAVSERLFSRHGYDGVSLRQIGTEAEVPFALATYHFKTKLGLYQAVFRRRIAEFRDDRRALLERVVIGSNVPENFLAISAAFVGPLMRLRKMLDGPQFSQLLAREIFDPNEADRGVVAEHFDPLARLTIDLLQRAAPQASKAQVARAYHFATGALVVNHVGNDRLKRVSDVDEKALASADSTEQLVHFIAAGLIAALYPDTFAQQSTAAAPRPADPAASPKTRPATSDSPGRTPSRRPPKLVSAK